MVFSDSFISEQEAQSLVYHASGDAHATYSSDFSAPDLAHNVRAADAGDGASERPEGHDPEFTYEIMNMPPNKYLCSIPILDDARPENRTAADLAKAEEAKELARASQRGWELLAPMDGHCLHFMSGWWSYRFCFGKNIVQYHALPQIPNGMPPVQDPDTLAFMLGRAPTPEEAGAGHAGRDQTAPPNTELQVKGDQRYLVQRLGGGTTCDLTGRERTIEVQYHCAPNANMDRIGYIKEVTTCAYLMVVNTPRLCDDVAFLPPRETTANAITCRPISEGNAPENHDGRTLGGHETPSGQVLGSTNLMHPPVVGGVVVGGHNILAGADGDDSTFNLDQRYLPNARGGGRIPGGAQPNVEVVASGKSKDDGGDMSVLSDEELEERDMDGEFVRGLVDELRDLAGDRGWKLEVVEEPGQDRELRGTVDVEEGENLGTLVQERDEEEADPRGGSDAESEGDDRKGEGKGEKKKKPEGFYN